MAVRRGVRAGRRQARARAALPRRARDRQDDAREGDRDRLQLAVRLDPGLRLRATFIGIDAIVVRYVAWKAKRLARKWGGQCIVFIDEIDAVGMRRQALGGGAPVGGFAPDRTSRDHLFFGPNGALTRSGDLILETRAWRERIFAQRAPEPLAPSGLEPRLGASSTSCSRAGRQGGGLALNQLLVVMDGIDNPPFTKRVLTNRINTFLDATYIVPRRLGKIPLRLPPPGPRGEQIYFIGATNVPLDRLDPALIRPGRMGRHVWFRTPTKHDRLDVFDLYLAKVAHDPDLDTPKRRDEIARITNGYSPAMIDQVCSMALTIAHHDGRERFAWDDLVEAMTTIESGTAIGIEYIETRRARSRSTRPGHAAAGHVFMKGAESTRLSIRMRGGSLGHHQALEKEERFSRFRSDEMARLVWTLGAMAAERVFYGENSNGVGGDVKSATAQAALMVGASAMGPEPFAVVAARRRERGPGPRARDEALRDDRRADHEPHERRRPVQPEPDRRRARRPRQARLAARSSARRTSRPTTSSSRTRTRSRRSPTSSSSAGRSSATTWSRSSTARS